jgi:hypothetical protein
MAVEISRHKTILFSFTPSTFDGIVKEYELYIPSVFDISIANYGTEDVQVTVPVLKYRLRDMRAFIDIHSINPDKIKLVVIEVVDW